MEIIDKYFDKVILFKSKYYKDTRGYFTEIYNSKLDDLLDEKFYFFQENQSLSNKNVFRGIHFQINFPQAKIIRVDNGSIIDFIIDLRKNSKTFLKFRSVELSKENSLQIYIPKGFGHAFLSKCDNSIVNYKVDNKYDPKDIGGINIINNLFDIKLPISDLIISEKDINLPNKSDFF